MDDMDIVTSEQIIGLISSCQKWTLLCFMQALYGTISFAYDIERKYYWDEKNVFFQLTMIQPEEDISPLPYFLVFCGNWLTYLLHNYNIKATWIKRELGLEP